MTEWPYARVLAETLAWPFWAPAAFSSSLASLKRGEDLCYGGTTHSLAVALEDHLRLRAGGASLNTLSQVRDYAWFPGQHTTRLSTLIQHAASQTYGHRDVPSDELSEPERVHRLRWMTLALPRDLLLAACLASKASLFPTGSSVSELLLPRDPKERFDLEELLERGLPEIHCHLSACLNFDALWTYLMSTAGFPRVDAKKLRNAEVPFGNTGTFLSWMATAALARMTLAKFLKYVDLQRAQGKSTDPPLVEFLGRQHFVDAEARQDHLSTLAALHRGKDPLPTARIHPAIRRYDGEHTPPLSCGSLDELAKTDPLHRCYTANGNSDGGLEEHHFPEFLFCQRSLRYLQSVQGTCDSCFETLFWQYQRIRCSLYRFVTQEPGTSGLDWFVRFFRRISPLRRGLDRRVLMDSVLNQYQRRSPSEHSPLQSVEVRIAPESRWNKLREEIEPLGKQQQEAKATQGACEPCPPKPNAGPNIPRGVVLHFQKDAQESIPRMPRLGGAAGDGLRYVRFGRYYRMRRKEATSISKLLDGKPESLTLLRGLDVCGQELNTPTWVLLPLLHSLREQSQQIAERTRLCSKPVRALRMTLHAGEDFRSLLEGLRRIHEPIEFGLLRKDDRIGHAVALGTDPELWRKQNPVAFQPREELLDDLLWVLSLDILPRSESSDWIQYADELAGRVYVTDYRAPTIESLHPRGRVAVLQEARRLRHSPGLLRSWDYPDFNDQIVPRSLPERFLFRYLTDPGVWSRGQVVEEFPHTVSSPARLTNLLPRVQAWVLQRVRSLNLTVEANPTSNLIIADIGALERHPMFRLRSISLWQRLFPCGPKLALSDDDPLTFAASLKEEFLYTYHAIRRQGESHDAALHWLEQRRKDGIAASFTLTDRPPTDGATSSRNPWSW